MMMIRILLVIVYIHSAYHIMVWNGQLNKIGLVLNVGKTGQDLANTMNFFFFFSAALAMGGGHVFHFFSK